MYEEKMIAPATRDIALSLASFSNNQRRLTFSSRPSTSSLEHSRQRETEKGDKNY